MISIIICSRNKELSSQLKQNIADTIRCAYELIIINNSGNKYSIFQAYNEGVLRAKGDILCFMHDDAMFHSKNWGSRVYDYFNNYPNLGCLGVAGCHLLLDTPSSFWHSGTFCTHYYSRNFNGDLDLIGLPDNNNLNNLIKVASVDGIWMCIRKSLFDIIRFDDISFDGFHCYDSDICMQILQTGYDIGIAFGIAVEHSKRGCQDTSYFKNIRIWHNKWEKYLPIARGKQYSDEDIEIRTYLVKQIVDLEEQVSNLTKVYDSKAYKIGKRILTPFKKITLVFPKKINK